MDRTTVKLHIRKALAGACHYSGLNSFLSGSPRWRILTYHRVTAPESETYPMQPGMYVRPETFEMQMRYLKDCTNCISLDELTQKLTAKVELPPRTVVVTFDDGWLDNYKLAYPVLKRFALPATIFLATDYIGTREYFWTDRIAQILAALAAERQFRDQILGRLWEKFQPEADIRTAIQKMLASGNYSRSDMDKLIEQLKARPALERKQVVNDLWLLAKEFGTLKGERLFMNWEEVVEMSKHGISFGSHTHHHYPLPELNDAQLKDEIVESYQQLKTHGLTPVSAFAYPGGYHNDATQRGLRALNIAYALITKKESSLSSTPALLGRIHIHEDMTSNISLFATKLFGPAVIS